MSSVRLNVLSQEDAARLLRWSLLYGANHPEEGFKIRQLVYQMKEMLSAPDLLMLAQILDDGGHPVLAATLRETATK